VLERPIERVAIFRALLLGDMLCATPALRAVRTAFANAQITLVGLPWARALAERLTCIDRFVDFPGYPGLPESPCDAEALAAFRERMQAERFDLAVQLHGSGDITNPLVASFGAGYSAGFRSPKAWYPPAEAQRYVAWPERGHEIERLLYLTDELGWPRRGLHLEFPVRDEDRQELSALWPGMALARPYVCVHAGAQLPSRRWPVDRFAAVADVIASHGRTVVLTGSAAEAELIAELAARMRAPAVNLAGRTSLWTLGAVVEGAEWVVCNDTGISHVAAALQRPSVVISSGSDVSRWAPLERRRHQVIWHDLHCRPCSHAVCPYQHDCAQAVTIGDVVGALRRRAGWRQAHV
jgi:ADP-heptose:LPS heptosyltransferase